MAQPKIPPDELRAFLQRQKLDDLGSELFRHAADVDHSRQFRSDFAALAFAITDPDWHKPPKPHSNPNLPPLRTYPLPRRLPFGPLRRMAKLIGPHSLRYLFQVGADQGGDQYRLELRPRLEKERHNAKLHKAVSREVDALVFGNNVLRLERDKGLARSAALAEAAERLGVIASSRTLERRFNDFRKDCHRKGFVPTDRLWARWATPEFRLCDLEGRPTDNPQK